MTTQLIPSDLIAKIKNHSDSKESMWQGLMSVIYNEREHANPWSYTDLVNYARLKYSDFTAFCVLLGKYNQQVENGGHNQYYDNGYSGEETRKCKCHVVELHELMMKYMAQFQFETNEIGSKVFQIMSEFVSWANKNSKYDRYHRDEDDDDDAYCELDNLDTRYYAINDNWYSFIENKIKEATNV